MARNVVIYKARNSGIRVADHERSKPTIPRFTNFENLQNRNEIKLNLSCCTSNKYFVAESIIVISIFIGTSCSLVSVLKSRELTVCRACYSRQSITLID